MPEQDPVTGASYFIGGDKPSVPAATKGLSASIRTAIIPIYQTATARDLAVTAAQFTPAGIPEGFKVYVKGSGDWEWDGAVWSPLNGVRIIGTWTYNGFINGTATPVLAPSNLGQNPSNVPGIHGQAFNLRRARMVEASIIFVVRGDTVPVQYRVRVWDTNGTDFCDSRRTLSWANGAGADWQGPIRSSPRRLVAGAQAIGALLELPAGAGSGQLNLTSMTVQLLDVGPAQA